MRKWTCTAWMCADDAWVPTAIGAEHEPSTCGGWKGRAPRVAGLGTCDMPGWLSPMWVVLVLLQRGGLADTWCCHACALVCCVNLGHLCIGGRQAVGIVGRFAAIVMQSRVISGPAVL